MGKEIQWLFLWHKMFTPVTSCTIVFIKRRNDCLSVKLYEKNCETKISTDTLLLMGVSGCSSLDVFCK